VKLFIPWRLFFRFLISQPAESREHWLTYFRFDDFGVALVPDVPIRPEEREGLLPSREQEERAVLSALAERKRAKIFADPQASSNLLVFKGIAHRVITTGVIALTWPRRGMIIRS
jgi:hypothetical protein